MPKATRNPLNVVRSLVPILKLRDGTRDDKLSLQIAEREGAGDNLKLTVRFTDGKVKKLVARYANLNRL